MDPMSLLSIGGPIVGALAGLFGGKGDADAAKEAQKRALEIIQGVRVPTVEEQQILLHHFSSAGALTPQLEQTLTQDPSKMESISVDPRLKQAQMSALQQLGQTANGGYSSQEQASMAKIQNQVAQAAHGRDEAILQQMAARGMGGSGSELAARMISQQGANNTQAQGGLDTAAAMNARALDAMSRYGTLGGQMDSQDFNQKAAKAQAGDEINRFNTANRQQVAGTNTGIANTAQATNLTNAQNIMNQNTGVANQQETYNKALIHQNYEDQMGKAKQLSDQYSKQAGYDNTNAQNTRNTWGGIGQAMGQGAAAVAANNTAATKAADTATEADKQRKHQLDLLKAGAQVYGN